MESRRMKRLLALLALPPIVAGCATPSQTAVDAEVKRLCAIDGGIKVYETVKLPATEFDQWGMPKMYQQRVENKAAYKYDDTRTVMEFSIGRDYLFRYEDQFYRKGNPKLIRHNHKLIRKPDDKLLGEIVSYGRGGGDLPGPWYPSSFTCPDVQSAGPNALMKAIFTQFSSRD
jgi:hypothetical protein